MTPLEPQRKLTEAELEAAVLELRKLPRPAPFVPQDPYRPHPAKTRVDFYQPAFVRGPIVDKNAGKA